MILRSPTVTSLVCECIISNGGQAFWGRIARVVVVLLQMVDVQRNYEELQPATVSL